MVMPVLLGLAIGLDVALGVALGVCGELEEHLLQPGAVGRPQLEDGYAGREGCVPDRVGLGLGKQGCRSRRTTT